MKYLEELKALLSNIKEKLNFNSTEDHNNFLENYKEDKDISTIAELLKSMNYIDIESKFKSKIGCFQNKTTFIPDDVNYISLLEDTPYYSVGVFFMPKGSVIPIHDHTNLMVLSKCLFGRLEVISYDKVNYKDTNM
jgi:hypothetical protein